MPDLSLMLQCWLVQFILYAALLVLVIFVVVSVRACSSTTSAVFCYFLDILTAFNTVRCSVCKIGSLLVCALYVFVPNI